MVSNEKREVSLIAYPGLVILRNFIVFLAALF